MEKNDSVKEWFLRAIAVVGLIAVLLLGAWGIIQLAARLPGFFGGIGGGTASLLTKAPVEELTVVAPASNTSGANLTLSWNHSNGSGEYAYTISYACASGLLIKAPLPNGSYQEVACNTPFDFVNASAHMILIPSVSGSAEVPATFTVSSTKLATGAITSSGSATTSIIPPPTPAKTAPAAATTAKKTTSAASGTYVAKTPRAAMYGLPDLSTNIISVSPASNGLTSVQFVITNNGTNIVPSGWTLSAALPLAAPYNLYSSQGQQALYPGDKILYTLTFSGANSGYNYPAYPSYPANTNYPSNCGYTTNYTYNGVYNYPSSSYTCTPYTYSNYNYGNNYNSYPQNYRGAVTITADPRNIVQEGNEQNNAATANI